MMLRFKQKNETIIVDTERKTYHFADDACIPHIELRTKGDFHILKDALLHSSEFREESTPITTRAEMRNLQKGDLFYAQGVPRIAAYDADLSGDASCDEYIVYDENGNSWFETDFPEKG